MSVTHVMPCKASGSSLLAERTSCILQEQDRAAQHHACVTQRPCLTLLMQAHQARWLAAHTLIETHCSLDYKQQTLKPIYSWAFLQGRTCGMFATKPA